MENTNFLLSILNLEAIVNQSHSFIGYSLVLHTNMMYSSTNAHVTQGTLSGDGSWDAIFLIKLAWDDLE